MIGVKMWTPLEVKKMKWEHKCSLEWLKKRQLYLTASDVKMLVPVTKTGKLRKVTDDDRLKLFAEKRATLTEEDCYSYGAAARGHILEPIAIQKANEAGKTHYKWWDDEIVTRPLRDIAYSPDAADVSIPEFAQNGGVITSLMEVKCYSNAKHLEVANTPINKLEERWQIATAMACDPLIEDALLVLYNPKLEPDLSLFIIFIDREDLQEEIDIVREVELEWRRFINASYPSLILRRMNGNSCNYESEEFIYNSLYNNGNLNP
jgi:hypothetical protein